MTKERRSARNQALPPEEALHLNSLDPDSLIKRVYDLYHEGWTLQSIGDALIPPRPRSTVRSWLLRFTPPEQRVTTPQDSIHIEDAAQKVIDAPIPSPRLKTSAEGYQKKKNSPGILPDELELIQSLAPIARTFRSKMPKSDQARVANDQLTAICIRLNRSGVQIRELAEAANVTYRAMYKRVRL